MTWTAAGKPLKKIKMVEKQREISDSLTKTIVFFVILKVTCQVTGSKQFCEIGLFFKKSNVSLKENKGWQGSK